MTGGNPLDPGNVIGKVLHKEAVGRLPDLSAEAEALQTDSVRPDSEALKLWKIMDELLTLTEEVGMTAEESLLFDKGFDRLKKLGY